MNVNSGGPHILLFERDQQLTTLLSGELVLAGYEVHTARTAVEVFDAIARFPVRLVMVNLAQAQAGRREFWVALDAQRRGRGVQVFTFRCTNLGGYGPDDPDERVETVLTDLEVDGMLGLVKLVDAVRARVPGSTVTTSAPAPAANVQGMSYGQNAGRQAEPLPPFQAPSTYQQTSVPQMSPPGAPAYQLAQQPQQPQQMMYQAPQQPQQPQQVVYQPVPMPLQASPVYQSAHLPAVQQPVYQTAPQQAQQPQQVVYQQAPMPPQTPFQASPVYQSAHLPAAQQQPVYQSAPLPQLPPSPSASGAQPLQGTLRPQPQEMPAPPAPPARPAETPRSGHSTFTDKIRAVIYPSSRSFSSVPEASSSPHASSGQAQNTVQYQNPDVQPRPQANQRLAEADYSSTNNNREKMIYQSTGNSAASETYTAYSASPAPSGGRPTNEESGLDQLSRMLRESQPTPQTTIVNGNLQNSAPHAGLNVDPQEIQDFRSQMVQAARMDEAHERSNGSQSRPAESAGVETQLRASPIQDIPFEQEIANRRGVNGGMQAPSAENQPRPAMTVLQPTQAMPQVPSTPGRSSFTDARSFAGSGTQPRPVASPETPISAASNSQIGSISTVREVSPQSRNTSGPLSLDEDITLTDQVRASLQQTISRRPEIRTSDDMLLDIVKSLPPMSPAPQPPQPQPPVLNGRATRSLGSVLLEGHLVPQERLQVAQHVQRMLRGVDLNYQLGEILLMFKLLTPDQLLAASLVSYGMISTVQISALGRIRQELHAMGLEYDLESLLILFRILSPEQLREVRASWSS